jgi:xylulokinase
LSLLGLDIGTTGCKAAVYSEDGSLINLAYKEYHLIRSQPGWAEFDSREVWETVKELIQSVASKQNADPITAMSISSCGEAMTPVSDNRDILDNAILGFDDRGSEYVSKFIDNVGEKKTFYISGNRASHYFSAPKLIWYKENKPEIYNKARYFLAWPDLVFYLLGCEPAIDFSLANRTLLFDIEKEQWSEELLRACGISIDKLPPLKPSGTVIGTISDSIADRLGLQHGVECVMGAHDQCCNALGAGVIRSGQAAFSIGTFMCIAPAFSDKPNKEIFFQNKLNIEHHVVPNHFVAFIYNMTGGSVLKWFRDEFSALEKKVTQEQGSDVYNYLMSRIPEKPTDLLVLPFFAPTGAPSFDAKTPGTIFGLRLDTSRWTLLKGLLEGATYFFTESMEIIDLAGVQINEYRPTGGGAKSDVWIQLIADIMGKVLVRPKILESGTLGAAILAGSATGIYDNLKQATEQIVKTDRIFEPDVKCNTIYQEKLEHYKKMHWAMKNLANDIL